MFKASEFIYSYLLVAAFYPFEQQQQIRITLLIPTIILFFIPETILSSPVEFYKH